MGNYWAEMADKNQTEAQIQFIKSRIKPEARVLDLACGSGRHLIALGILGFKVVGLDVSASLLKIAKQRGRHVQVIRGDLRMLPIRSEVFAAVVSMATSFGYLPSKKGNQQSLLEVRRVMVRGGVLVVDLFNRGNLIAKNQIKSPPKWREYPSFFLKQERTLSSTRRRLCDLWTIRDKATGLLKRFRHSVQVFGQEEMKALLKEAGFGVKQVYGSYDCGLFGESSSRMILLALACEVRS